MGMGYTKCELHFSVEQKVDTWILKSLTYWKNASSPAQTCSVHRIDIPPFGLNKKRLAQSRNKSFFIIQRPVVWALVIRCPIDQALLTGNMVTPAEHPDADNPKENA